MNDPLAARVHQGEVDDAINPIWGASNRQPNQWVSNLELLTFNWSSVSSDSPLAARVHQSGANMNDPLAARVHQGEVDDAINPIWGASNRH